MTTQRNWGITRETVTHMLSGTPTTNVFLETPSWKRPKELGVPNLTRNRRCELRLREQCLLKPIAPHAFRTS